MTVLVVCLAASCGGDDDDGTTTDSGTGADSSVTVDAARDGATTTTDSATASGGSSMWQLLPNAVCTGTTVSCSDQGAFGGYLMFAGGAACPLMSGFSFTFRAGALPAAGSYAVRPGTIVSGPPPAGEVVVRLVHSPTGTTQENWFAQNGTVTVTSAGGKITATLPLVNAKKDATALTQMMMGTATCP